MGKLRPEKSSKSSQHKKSNGVLGTPSSPAKRKPQPIDAPALLAQATALLQQGQPDTALSNARRALFLLSPSDSPTPSALSALSLLGEIHIELGDAASALETFKTIVSIDPEGSLPESNGQGADPFLELAQLCDGGGKESIQWFDRGIAVLEREIQTLSTLKSREEELEDKRRKLAAAICGKIEVWMTDLS